jgi:hypothetical protein
MRRRKGERRTSEHRLASTGSMEMPESEMFPRLPLSGGLERGPTVAVTLDGRPTTAYLGESVATMLLAEGHIATRTTRNGSSRGVFCAMGVCFDCLVVVDGVVNTRACVAWVRDGMQVARQEGYTATPGDPARSTDTSVTDDR